jgi:DNA-binding NtrC family response regulator
VPSERKFLRILIVEDEPLIAMFAEEAVADLGHQPIVAASCEAAKRCMAEHDIDAAILDFILKEETSEEIALVLQEKGVPFVFATGNGTVNSASGEGVEILVKPYTSEDLTKLIANFVFIEPISDDGAKL